MSSVARTLCAEGLAVEYPVLLFQRVGLRGFEEKIRTSEGARVRALAERTGAHARVRALTERSGAHARVRIWPGAWGGTFVRALFCVHASVRASTFSRAGSRARARTHTGITTFLSSPAVRTSSLYGAEKSSHQNAICVATHRRADAMSLCGRVDAWARARQRERKAARARPRGDRARGRPPFREQARHNGNVGRGVVAHFRLDAVNRAAGDKVLVV